MIKKNNNSYNKGFTLVELLVVTAVIGVLGVLSATLISSILRSQNKTAIINEVRQNGDLVISKFERDVKQSSGISITGAACPPTCTGTSVTLTTYQGTDIIWVCTPAAAPADGGFTRNGTSVINEDSDNGVSVSVCGFTLQSSAGANIPQIVRLQFTLEQRSDVQRAEYQVREPFQVTAGTRAY